MIIKIINNIDYIPEKIRVRDKINYWGNGSIVSTTQVGIGLALHSTSYNHCFALLLPSSCLFVFEESGNNCYEGSSLYF
jgi:hypothetical protein